MDQLLDTALQAYDQVVIDAGSHLDEPSLTALERADGVVFTVYPEIAALKALHSLLDVPRRGRPRTGTKATFVLNNMFARDILKMSQIESALGTPGRGRAAVRPVHLPQGDQRGRSGRARGAAFGGRGAAVAARLGRVRPGARAARAGDRRRQEERAPRGPHPPLTGIPRLTGGRSELDGQALEQAVRGRRPPWVGPVTS